MATITQEQIEAHIDRLREEMSDAESVTIDIKQVGSVRVARALLDLAAAQNGGIAKVERDGDMLTASLRHEPEADDKSDGEEE